MAEDKHWGEFLAVELPGWIGRMTGRMGITEYFKGEVLLFSIDFDKHYQQLKESASPPSRGVPHQVSGCLWEACWTYLFGLYKSACIISVTAVELALKERYELIEGKTPPKDINFSQLLEWAEKKGMLKGIIKSLSKAIRLLQNAYKHDIVDAELLDAFTNVTGALRIINSIYEG